MAKATRRTILAGGAAALPLFSIGRAYAAPSEVEIALLAPLSGSWAYNGRLEKIGAEIAVADINAAGGIHAIGGAKVKLRVSDAGGSVQDARAAAQRVVSQESNIVAGIGCWLSSFTLTVSEVAEQAKLPWVTLSWVDELTSRGNHYIICTSAPSSSIITNAFGSLVDLVKKTSGTAPKTVALISDNTASQAAMLKTMRNGLLAKFGLKAVMDQVFSPPLANAGPLALDVRRAKPEMILLNTSSIPDSKLLLQALNEYGMGNGRIPIFAPVPTWGYPALLKTVGGNMLQGLIGAGSDWGKKNETAFLAHMNKASGLPWQPQETLQTYGNLQLIVDAISRAKSTDRDKVMAAMLATDTTTGPAKYFLGDHLSFEPNGRRKQREVALFQWQKSVPMTVSPVADALAPLLWPKKA